MVTKTRIPKGETREHILNIASWLFYTQGIRAVGIDTIVAQSGVAKTTLYDHFRSKDDLIGAYLEKRDDVFWEDFERALAQHPADPRQQIRDVFAMLQQMITSPESLGCPFLNAASEFPEPEHIGHQVALAHKQKVRERLATLGTAAGAGQPDALADHLLLALDGAFASRRVFRDQPSPAQQLTAVVEMLLTLHLGS